MKREHSHILEFDDISIEDVPLVGGKNAALGEMFSGLVPLGINIPDGFSVTAYAYNHFLENAGIKGEIENALKNLDTRDIEELQKKGEQVRNLILSAELPDDLVSEIKGAYKDLEGKYSTNVDVAVRSSATAEDLPGASFAGQQETYLNIVGEEHVLESVKKCFASLFTNRAISYRQDKGFPHIDVALSVAVQKMIRSDLAASGVTFSIDTETGFDKVVIIDASYGLGEILVQGKVIPDEFVVFKPSLESGFGGIIARDLGRKEVKIVYSEEGTKIVNVPTEEQGKYCLTDGEIRTLAEWTVKIEKYFSKKYNRYQPMDIEWAKDGVSGELFIVQARPETVHSVRDMKIYVEYRLKESGEALIEGIAVGTKIAKGAARVIKNAKNIGDFKKGEVLVTEITDPDWEPIMKIASAIVTDKGGRTSHAAIVSRELGIPAIVGTMSATERIAGGEEVTVDCSSGKKGIVYKGSLSFEKIEHRLNKIPETKTKVMVNIGSPEEAFKNHYLPARGVGLGRLEFIISSHIQIHPNALIGYDALKEVNDKGKREVIKKIDELTRGYGDKKQYYIDELAEGIAKIGAAFWPHDVIIRFSDFKTNEYRTLVGGALYEPEEANPMIGWRGASRYYDGHFKEAFGLECAAVKKVREEIGLENIVVMVPFCRTPLEGEKVLAVMGEYGLSRETDGKLKIYVMCEVPSNVVLVSDFLKIFDGMSIGSNDLTQLVLGIDRDSDIVQSVGNENNPAVKEMIAAVIAVCRKQGKYIGICGQAPSDFPEFTAFLVEQGIESISLSPDTVIKMLPLIAEEEAKLL